MSERRDPNADSNAGPDEHLGDLVSAGREHGMREREPALSCTAHFG
jgi:hypothetical protein